MALQLPNEFRKDLGRNTNLFPIVEIGDIYISTNAYSLNGKFYKPLLLNIPSLKESIDLEKRNYKISSINLDITNYEYEGQRFSELVSGSLINTEVNIYYVSQSNVPFQIYKGIVRRYEHTDEKVKIIVEDSSQKSLHQDLPINKMPTTLDVPEKYRNKPIPMVFGEVDKSPMYFQENYTSLIGDVYDVGFNSLGLNNIEFNNSNFTINTSPLYMYTGDNYVNVQQYDADNIKQFSEIGSRIVFNSANSHVLKGSLINSGTGIPEIEQENYLYSVDSSKAYQVSLSNTLEDSQLNNDDFDIPYGSLGKISDGSYLDNIVNWSSDRNYTFLSSVYETITESNDIILFYNAPNSGNLAIDFRTILVYNDNQTIKTELLLLKLNFNCVPNYDYLESKSPAKIFGMKINNTDISFNLPSFSENSHSETHFPIQSNPKDGQSADFIQGTSDDYFIYDKFGERPNSLYNDVLKHIFSFKSMENESYGYNSNAAIQINISSSIDLSSNSVSSTLDLSGSNIQEIDIYRYVNPTKIFEQEYYGYLRGRAYREEQYEDENDDIEIIYKRPNSNSCINHILTQELGVSNIIQPEDNTYEDWIYDFTVVDTINSKKLIENIGSASPMIPRFDYNGNFKFDVIPKEGGVADHTIEEDNIISFSYSRTKPEDIYTKIEFKYNWDYAREEFSKEIQPITVDEVLDLNTEQNQQFFDYYGIKTDHSESTLIIDDDRGKYIRHDLTAERFASWLLSWHCNQHLKMKVQLPLSAGLEIEIGDLVKFDSVIGGIKPYNIDYAKTNPLNGQTCYPRFMVVNTNKTLDSVSLELIQMHQMLYAGQEIIEGCMDTTAVNYNQDANYPVPSMCVFSGDLNPPSISTIEYDYIPYNDTVINQEVDKTNFDDSDYSINSLKINFQSILQGGVHQLINDASIELSCDNPKITTEDLSGLQPIIETNESTGLSKITFINDSTKLFSYSDKQDGDEFTVNVKINFTTNFENQHSPPFVINFIFNDTVNEYMLGDMDGTGGLNVVDVVQMMNLVLSQLGNEESLAQYPQADMNGDGGLNILDVVTLVTTIMGDDIIDTGIQE